MSGIADREAGSAGKVWPRSPLEASREHLQAVNSHKGRGLGAQPSLQGQSCHQRHVMLTPGPTAGMQAGAQCMAPCLLVESIFRSEDGWPPTKTRYCINQPKDPAASWKPGQGEAQGLPTRLPRLAGAWLVREEAVGSCFFFC